MDSLPVDHQGSPVSESQRQRQDSDPGVCDSEVLTVANLVLGLPALAPHHHFTCLGLTGSLPDRHCDGPSWKSISTQMIRCVMTVPMPAVTGSQLFSEPLATMHMRCLRSWVRATQRPQVCLLCNQSPSDEAGDGQLRWWKGMLMDPGLTKAIASEKLGIRRSNEWILLLLGRFSYIWLFATPWL